MVRMPATPRPKQYSPSDTTGRPNVARIHKTKSFFLESFVTAFVYLWGVSSLAPISAAPPISGVYELSSVVSNPRGDCPMMISAKPLSLTHFHPSGNSYGCSFSGTSAAARRSSGERACFFFAMSVLSFRLQLGGDFIEEGGGFAEGVARGAGALGGVGEVLVVDDGIVLDGRRPRRRR